MHKMRNGQFDDSDFTLKKIPKLLNFEISGLCLANIVKSEKSESRHNYITGELPKCRTHKTSTW